MALRFFNRLQIPRFLSHWHTPANKSKIPEELRIVENVRALAGRYGGSVHLYLRFVGDYSGVYDPVRTCTITALPGTWRESLFSSFYSFDVPLRYILEQITELAEIRNHRSYISSARNIGTKPSASRRQVRNSSTTKYDPSRQLARGV